MEPSSSKVAPRKFWERKIWQRIGATQRFDHNAEGPKLWQVGCIRGFSLELAFANLGREILGTEIFEKHGCHAAFRLRRGAARAKSSRYSALDSCEVPKKRAKKKNRESFPVFLAIKTTPEGGINLSIYFLFCFFCRWRLGFATNNDSSTSWFSTHVTASTFSTC